MQLTIPRDDLAAAVDTIKSVVGRTSTLPILNHVLLHANGNGVLELTGTNLERETVYSAKAEIDAPGSYAVPGAILQAVVKGLPKGAAVTLKLDGPRIDLVAGRSRYRLGHLPAEDFPQLAPEDTQWAYDLEVNARALAKLCDVSFACSDNIKERVFLTGSFFRTPEDKPGVIRATGCDGRRLASMEIDLPEGAPPFPALILPADACGDISSALADAAANDAVRLRANSGRVAVDFQSVRLVTKLIDGKYPPTEHLVPTPGQPHRAEFRRAEMVDTLSRVRAVAQGQKTHIVYMVFSGEELALRAKHEDGHEASDGVAAACNGDGYEVGCNAALILEHLNKMRGVKVVLEQEMGKKPMRLYDDGVAEAVHIVMPFGVQ